MMNDSPYVRISAILFVIISTDLPATLAVSIDCDVETFLSKLCASSNTVTCLNDLFIPPSDIRNSLSLITKNPIIRALVSAEPVRLKSMIVFLLNSSSSEIDPLLNILSNIPSHKS